jgi:3-oxoacyl-[acyl-carrier-protein] synthase II
VFSGFSALMAMDKTSAKPFDKNRQGLTPGEACGFMLLTGASSAAQEKSNVLGEILGAGLTNDANHMTGPSRDGLGLSLAIGKSLVAAGLKPQDIGSICAHGTGTLYNDSMEMKAFKKIFHKPVPAYSIKGAIGHTMAAAGVVEAAICLKALKEQKAPLTVGLEEIDEEARGWVCDEPAKLSSKIGLSVNAGFGGVNSALVLRV